MYVYRFKMLKLARLENLLNCEDLLVQMNPLEGGIDRAFQSTVDMTHYIKANN